MNKFSTTPNKINRTIRKFPTDLIHHIIPHLENEAIDILIDAGICDEAYYNPPGPSDLDAWRAFWLNEAHHQCDDFDPVGSAGEHLNQAQRAAVNVLVSASALRESLEHGAPGEAAALAMILVSDAVIGGLSIDLTDTADKLAQSTKAKRVPYELGIGKRQAAFDKAKIACIMFAADAWKIDPEIKMKSMAAKAFDHIAEKFCGEIAPGNMPEEGTVLGWLRKAGTSGELQIPAVARKGGRPKRQANTAHASA